MFQSYATHFRYGNISWRHISGNTYEITVSQAWRTTFFTTNPLTINVNDVVDTQTDLLLGDGSTVPIKVTVTSVNRPPIAANGWFYGVMVYTKTYASTGNKNVSFQACCRIDGLLNTTPGTSTTSFYCSTVINVGTSNNSPLNTLNPIVNIQSGTIDKFSAKFTEPDGNPVTYRLATNAEMIGVPPGDIRGAYTIPVGTSIDPLTGEVTVNATTYPIGSILTLGVIASDGLTSVKVDFIIQVVGQSTPPQFDYTITPPLGQFYSIKPGQHLNLHFNAFDTDPGSFVFLSAVGVPIGGTFNPTTAGLTQGNPLDYTFNWTPTTSQLGTYVVNVLATDNANVQTPTTIVIKVSMAPEFNVPPTPSDNFLFITEPNNTVAFSVKATNPDPTDGVTLLPISLPPAGVVYTAQPNPTFNSALSLFSWTPAVAEWGEHDFVFNAVNSNNDQATHHISVLVNSIPVIASTPVSSVTVNNLYTYNFVSTDADVPYGDTLETTVLGLPSWLTFTDHEDGTGTFSGTPGTGDAGTFEITVIVEDIHHHTHPQVEQIFDITVKPCTLLSTGFTKTSITCFGLNNGTATFNTVGATGSLTYLWNNGATTKTTTGLAAGLYIVTAKDSLHCAATDTVTISQPDLLRDTIIQTSLIRCYGGNDASAIITGFGGTQPYSYLWSTGTAGSTIPGLTAGTYTGTITDANGCTVTNSILIGQPALLVSTTTANSYASCFGDANGSASVTASGGTLPYSFVWSNGNTTDFTNGLTAGTYSVTTTDLFGCTSVNSVVITQPSASLHSSSTVSNVTCFGFANGMADVITTGGTSPYSYLWSNGIVTDYNTGLAPGTYSVMITDANGCTTSNSIIITEPPALVSTTTISNVSCFGLADGSAILNTSGGTPAYKYLWSTGDTTSAVGVLAAGTYTVTTTDSKGCKVSKLVTVTQPSALVSTHTISNVSCFGGNNGSGKVTVSGGAIPYTYLWSNGATTSTITGLSPGTYTETTTDAKGCQVSDLITITQPAAFVVTLSSPTVIGSYNTSCNPTGDGQVFSSISGGLSPYVYVWSTGQSASSISGLNAGNYSLVVTDANGCIATKSISLSKPVNCNCAIAPTTAPSLSCATCNQVLDGQSNVVINSGTQACIKNSFTGNISMNGGTLVICGVATVQNLAIPSGSKVVVLGTLIINELNMNGSNASLENFGTIDVKNNFNANGIFKNQGSFTVENTANFNSSTTADNYSMITVKGSLNNNKILNNFGTLIVHGVFTNNSGSSFINNCLTAANSFIVNSQVAFANNGTLDVTKESRFNSATASISGGSVFQTQDIYLNGTTVSLSGNVCALINVNAFSQINQSSLSGPVSYCDANGIETKNNFQLLSGSVLSCTTCKYTGALPIAAARLGDLDTEVETVNLENAYALFPNPASKGDVMTITSNSTIVKTDIYEANGRFIKTQANNQEVDTNGLNSGLYILKLTDAQNQIKTIRFMVLN